MRNQKTTNQEVSLSREFKQSETREIKKALMAHFDHPFSVTKGKGTAHHWIHISWTDGPADEAVRDFCFKFNDSSRDDIQTDLWIGSQYTSEHRENSAEAYLWAVKEIEKEWNIKLKVSFVDSWRADGKKSAYIERDDDILVDTYGNRHASQLVNIKLFETDFRNIDLSKISI